MRTCIYRVSSKYIHGSILNTIFINIYLKLILQVNEDKCRRIFPSISTDRIDGRSDPGWIDSQNRQNYKFHWVITGVQTDDHSF